MSRLEDEGHWTFREVLGAGAFGVVELWQRDNSGITIAIKKWRGGLSQITDKQKERWVSEVQMMNSLCHPNVVGTRRLPGQLCDIGGGIPVLCMEYCSRGDLRRVLNQSENCCGIEEKEALKIMQDISSAVEYLHSCTLVHRDLKPENIVLSGTKEKTVYKLTDLGYVRELGEESLDASVVGTRNYLAPELLWKRTYTCSVDYWSLGILFYEVATGNRPFLPNMPITEKWVRSMEKKRFEHITARCESGSNVVFGTEIEKPSSLSDYTRQCLTPWFRIVLQWDPRRRGRQPFEADTRHDLLVFSMLKRMFHLKIVYVFVPAFYRTDSYSVTPDITIHQMQNLIFEKTKIVIAHQTLTDSLGYEIDHSKIRLFAHDEEVAHLVVFEREKLRVENPPQLDVPVAVRQIIDNPSETLGYEITKRRFGAALFFIDRQLDLFRRYIIALSIKIDLSNRKVQSLRESVRVLTESAEALMNELNLETQSFESSLRCERSKGSLETIRAKTQKLLEGAQDVLAKLEELSESVDSLTSFSDMKWLDKWTQLRDKAKAVYEDHLVKNPGERGSSVPMVRLLYEALKLHHQQLGSPEIETVVSDITHLDTNILQLQEYLKSSEVLVHIYRKHFQEQRRYPEQSTLRISENTIIMDNIVMTRLLDGVIDAFQGQLVGMADEESEGLCEAT